MAESTQELHPKPWKQWIKRISDANWISTVLVVLLAFLVGGLLILAIGGDPIKAYLVLIKGSFGDRNGFAETIVKTCPMLLAGLSVAIALRTEFWNVGAEGQIYAGAVLTGLASIYIKGIPAVIHLPLALLAGALGGALWAFIPAILKARLKVNEVITTLMMNYIMTFIFSFLVDGPMRDWVSGLNISPQIEKTTWLPILLAKTRLHSGILFAILAAVILAVVIQKTVLGYQIRVVGDNPRAARFAGIAVENTMVKAVIISGMLAGLAGAIEITGVQHRLIAGFSPGYGFLGLAVALLASLNPIGVIFSALLFAALLNGADAMQRWASVPIAMVAVIQGLVIIFSAIKFFFSRSPLKRKAGS